MKVLFVALVGGVSLIIYAISLFLKIFRGEEKNKSVARNKAMLILSAGLIVFVGGTYLSTYIRDKDRAAEPHHLYKDLTFEEWKTIVADGMQGYRDCTKNMDKGNYDLQAMCIQSLNYKETDFKHDLETKANLSGDQIQQLKDYWDAQRTETTRDVNAQIEANDRRNYPNKYQ